MGWFQNRIEERRKSDRQALEDSCFTLMGVLMGENAARQMRDSRIVTMEAVDEILKYFHLKPVKVPDTVAGSAEMLEYCLRPYGIMRRRVELSSGWYKDAFGPILAYRKGDKAPTALIPGKFNHYYYRNPNTGEAILLNKSNEGLFEREALCFYKALPMRKIGVRDLLVFMHSCFTAGDRAGLILSVLSVTLIGLLLPAVTRLLTGPVLESGRPDALIGAAITILGVALSSQLMTIVRELMMQRISAKTSTSVMAAMIMRVMSLPASFFRDRSPGELRSRVMLVMQLCNLLVSVVISAGMLSAASLLYLVQILNYTPVLVIPAVLVILLRAGLTVLVTRAGAQLNLKKMEQAAAESDMTYSMITGVQKIKLAGAEKRLFAKWLKLYAKGAALNYNPPLLLKVEKVIALSLTLLSTIALYAISIRSGIDPSSYYAFTAAWGAVMGALAAMENTARETSRIRPILSQVTPFLETEPESSENREVFTSITGSVSMEHVWFRYAPDTPYILRDLSLKIRPGDYVAVVGKTGCGKSTLIRLLLGFEKPEKGAVFYDGKNLEYMDHTSLRKKIGTVLQSGSLFQGDIFSNIIISSPELTMDDAWNAAEAAGIAEDIRSMPMGMHTMISDDQSMLSGGQRQRLMIARAIAPKPRLLIFDEATSALDNKTQQQVSDALDNMGCTRLVIAHRLSTIRRCSRILVLEDGRIVEEGTYDELIKKNGFFADLVRRQRPDVKTEA